MKNEITDYILAIDTATPACSVALTSGGRDGGRVVACQSISSRVTQSRRLLGSIDRLLTETEIAKEAVRGYAIGLGPGSFTGLRIGMATVKGLAAASDAPLYGVSTLDVLVAGCACSERLICAAVDARKNEVYAAFYRSEDGGPARRLTSIAAFSPEALAARIHEPVVMIGDALRAYGEYWRSVLGDTMTTAPAHLWSPSAGALGLLAGELALRGQALDVAAATPLYVRASDAELNLIKQAAG